MDIINAYLDGLMNKKILSNIQNNFSNLDPI